MYIRCIGNHFSWSKNFPFGRGIAELVRNALVPKLPLSAEMKGNFFFFKQLNLGN